MGGGQERVFMAIMVAVVNIHYSKAVMMHLRVLRDNYHSLELNITNAAFAVILIKKQESFGYLLHIVARKERKNSDTNQYIKDTYSGKRFPSLKMTEDYICIMN